MKSKNKKLVNGTKISSIAVLVLIAAFIVSGCVGDGGEKQIQNTQGKISIPPSPKATKELGLPAEPSIKSPFENLIIGRWAKLDKENPVILQFGGSGIVTMIAKLPGDKEPTVAMGIYRFKSSDALEMTFPVSGGTGYYSVVNRIVGVSDTSLTLEDQDGLNTVDLIKMRTDK